MARASVIGRRDYTRGVRSSGHHPLDAAQELATRIGTGPTVAWDLAMLQLRRQYADQLVDGIGPDGRDHVARGRDGPRGGPPARHRAGRRPPGLGLHVPGLVRRQPARGPGRGAGALRRGPRRPAGRSTTRCWSSRRSGTWATTPTTTVTTAARWPAWQESTAGRGPGRARLGVLAQQLLLAVLARDAGDEAGARALAAEIRRWAEQLGATRLSGPGRPASWPGWTPRRRRRRPPPIGETAVPYGGTAGHRDDARSGERLAWLMRLELLVRMRRAG